MISVLSDRNVTSKNQAAQLILTEDDWDILDNIVIILEPFQLVTTLLSSDSQPTLSIVMPILKSLIENFISKMGTD